MKVVCICYDGSEISDKTVNSIVAIVSTFAKDKSKVLVNRYGDKDIADALSVLSSKVVCFVPQSWHAKYDISSTRPNTGKSMSTAIFTAFPTIIDTSSCGDVTTTMP